MEKANITAIIPTYKRPLLLKRAVKSVLAQTYPHFTLLIADNASGEETDRVVEAYIKKDARVKWLKHPTNLGAIKNFQEALMATQTPYVCFLPDDDFFAPFFFEEVLPTFSRYPDIAFCGGGGVLIDKTYKIKTIEQNQQRIPPSGYYAPPEGLFMYYSSQFGIAFPPLLFRTEILKKIGGFDLRIRNGGDEHLISQCAARYPIYLITDRPFYFAYQHEGSLSGQTDFPLFEREAACLYENICSLPFRPHEKEEIDSLFKKRQLKILSNAYRYFCNLKDFVRAQEYAKKVYRYTKQPIWKRKQAHAALCYYLPSLASVYQLFKTLEQRIRALRKPKPPLIQQEAPEVAFPEAVFWEAYAKNLEKD